MKNICFITLGNLYLCPYLEFYLRQINGPYTVIFWDREQRNETANGQAIYKRFSFSCTTNNNFRKIMGYIKFRKYIKRTLHKNVFDVIVLLQTQAALLVYDLLLKYYKGKYIIDIRDYSYEKYNFIYNMEATLIKNSLHTIISSNGYRAFLPPHDYLVIHNLRYLPKVQTKHISLREKRQNVLTIAFIGFVNYQKQHQKLILSLKDDSRFELRFIGTRAKELEAFCQDHAVKNVTLIDTFDSSKIVDLYHGVDFVNNLYGNHTPVLDYALSNKLYFAAELRIPILVCPDMYMSDVVEDYGIGLTVDINSYNLGNTLYDYYWKINWEVFDRNCSMFLDKAYVENNNLEKLIKETFL